MEQTPDNLVSSESRFSPLFGELLSQFRLAELLR